MTIKLAALPPLSLYIHFPWCEKKCPYCDFNSHQIKDTGFDEARYLRALIQDLQTELPRIWGRKVQTIFIGGGTPSLISPAGIDWLLSSIRALVPLDPAAEITLEANPGSVEAAKFAAFAGTGINRISLGIQSFHDAQLQALGRIHNGNQAKRAIEIAQTHFQAVNLDLMYALPQQTCADATVDLRTALAFNPTHLSLYHLTLEPNTLFASQPPVLPNEDDSDAIFENNLALLTDAGYARYEVSAYSKPQQACKHNLNYWQFGDYIGIGAGAHGKISLPHSITRQVRERHPETYMHAMETQGHALIETRELTPSEIPFEFMLNALRLTAGVATTSFAERTGLSLQTIGKEIERATAKGLLDSHPTTIKPTALGLQYLNDLQELFLKSP
ncbi:radical SAM family heme chaperone HemW [Polynucleobacter sp. IMCC30063]|uniref:radical SAM family heme chaperone HemW n=1 Tax=Polynucleobacter sp. IMCC30063 TaxID=2907298 RepID=UPI001F2969CD|nr:radical SAM family heme chaperone HemW [Polynucleobacter sp. IMCC30063]MCE7505779.1 radical SAM family heme chaperone HemW [Polynucleobacter sp. IMCC30063]